MGAATKLRLAIYLPLVVLIATVLLLRSGLGSASDDVAPARSGPPPVRWAHADGVMTTFDGLDYELDAAGTFQLALSKSQGLDVQLRVVATGTDGPLIERVAAQIGNHRVQFAAWADQVRIDGRWVTFPPNSQIDFGDGAGVYRRTEMYVANWPGTGFRPRMRMSGRAVDVRALPARDVRGLFGNADGKRGNDLVAASDWRIEPGDSLFD